jgi:hypothetical protein
MKYVIKSELEKSDIVKEQRNKGIGKLGMQKTVDEDRFDVEPEEASKLHTELEQEHLKKMNKFDEVIDGFKKKMKKLDPGSEEYKKLHSIIGVNKVEKERHRQHAESHKQCHIKHGKLAKLYKKGIPSDAEVESIVNEKSIGDGEVKK